jgi:tetratricopeptide (TPR) repeat protein
VAGELAYLYLEHGGNVNVALSLAQEAKQRTPDSPAAAATLGWAYYKLGSIGPAISQLEESVRKEPGNALYQYHLGMAYLGARRFDVAARSLEKSLKDDPHSPRTARIKEALGQISNARP